MKKRNREVFGSYTHPEEAVSAIQKLKEDGYTREEITVYSNKEGRRTFDVTAKDSQNREDEGDFDTVDENSRERSEEGSFDKVDRSTEKKIEKDTENNDENDDDDSLWDSVKDFFTPDSYDYEEEAQDPNYRKENDVLYPHRQDLADGNRVVVLDKPLEDENRVQI